VAKDAIVGFERSDDENESGWMVKLRGVEELLPMSRRQQYLVKEFK
jgi:two-component system response regulator AlgR